MASDGSDINHYVQSVSFLMQEKGVIKSKLSLADAKLQRLEKILQKKSASTGGHKNAMRPDEMTQTNNGMRVSDFRLAQRSSKVTLADSLSRSNKGPERLQKENNESMSLELIHHRHLQRTVCKREVSRKLQEIEDVKAKKEKKAQGRKLPQLTVPDSMLPNRYLRGELPCNIEHGTKGHYLSWVCPLENLDYEYYLPIFFDGLQSKEAPIPFLARQGIEDLLFAANGHPDRIIPCIRYIVRPLRNALSKFDVELLLAVLKAIQQLINSGEGIGQALLPYSKQFLAPMAAFMDNNKNIGDSIDYGQRKNDDLGEQIRNTLELLEEHGGPKALTSIKFSLPLYESCLKQLDFRRNEISTASTASR